MNKPLLLLDIDGVLNPLGSPEELPTTIVEVPGNEQYIVNVPDGMARKLKLLSYDWDLMWASMWMREAHLFGRLLGLPSDMPWINFKSDLASMTTGQLLDKLLGRESYKLATIERMMGQHDRPVVWIDDEAFDDAQDWAAARTAGGAPTKIVKTNPMKGLTSTEITTINRWREENE